MRRASRWAASPTRSTIRQGAPETLRRIREAADRLGYAPNQSARMLAGGKNRLFGLILPNLDHGVSLQIANGCERRGAQARIRPAHRHRADGRGCRTSLPRLLYWHADGGHPHAAARQHGLAAPRAPASHPLAFLDIQCDVRVTSSLRTTSPSANSSHATPSKSGARRVAIIGKPSLNRLVLRVKGMKHAFTTESDCAFEVVEEGAWNSAHDGLDLGRQLAERPEDTRPDFIIALTDTLATGAISGVRAAGLRVPGDIRVAGCDGNPLAWTGPVPLTTIAPIGYELGRRGVRQLIAQIEEGPEHEPENHQGARATLPPRAGEHRHEPL